MTIERQADHIAKGEAPVDGRAVWTAPVLLSFDVLSAETGPGYGSEGYGLS